MNSNTPDPSRLSFRIRYLRPSRRALDACETLGVDTVGDFCERARAEFLALPNFGERTWKDLSRRVEAFLDENGATPDMSAEALDRPVQDVIRNRRALRACRQLKVRTVGELLATPRKALLEVPGFGERTLWEVHRELGHSSAAEVLGEIVPPILLELPVGKLPEPSRSRIDAPHDRRLSDVLAEGSDEATRSAVRDGLDALLRRALASDGVDFSAWLRGARHDMHPPDRQLFDRVSGVVRRPLELAQASALQGLSHDDALASLDAARRVLLEAGGGLIDRWARELDADLRALGGVVTPTTLAATSSLRAATRAAREPFLPLRIVTFCRPDVGHVHENSVCRLDSGQMHRLEEALRARIAHDDRAVPLAELRESIPDDLRDQDCHALVVHVLRHRLHRTVRMHPTQGEVVLRLPRSLADRMEAILESQSEPLGLNDLLFHYRDRHGKGRRARLENTVRSDGRFLQVGAETWSLRSWHLDELELVRPEAERIRGEIVTYGGRRGVLDLREGPTAISERTAWLLVDHLRKEPSLRDLGRGEFCPRRSDGSPLVADIVRTLRHAMGEVPFARFLQNQPPNKRRLVSRLLRVNRMFVSPSRDRVDLAENFPCTGERLRMLLQETRIRVDHAGYATLPQVHEAVGLAGLGGEFLTEHLLLDILRRHGDFEVLPGPIVADPRLGLGQWIQRTTRQILRARRDGLTPEQLLAERPELAEFATALPELMELDPLVQSDDGLHYHLV